MAPKHSEVKTFFGQCHCCLQHAYLKNIWEQYQNDGHGREIYGKMLLDCFSISWTIHKQVEDDKICDICITKLRDALNFKSQVLQSQQELMEKSKAEDLAKSITDIVHVDVPEFKDEVKEYKIEYVEEEILDGSDNKESIKNDLQAEDLAKSITDIVRVDVPEFKEDEVKEYKIEYLEEEILDGSENKESIKNDMQEYEPELKRRKEKESKKSGQWISEQDSEDGQNEYMDYEINESDSRGSDKKLNLPLKIERMNETQPDSESDSNEDTDPKSEKQIILEKHRNNIRSILISSNATPIKGYWETGYCCCYCSLQFNNPNLLKQHTFTHEDVPFKLKIKSLTDHVVKLDISFLQCIICGQNIKSLEVLMNHIKEKHQMPIHWDIPNHIIPFKFEKKVLTCCKCPTQFDSFKSLSEHMGDVHCRNYGCNQCHRGFVNVRSFKTHSMRHGVDIFACSFCAKVLNTQIEITEHEKVMHHLNSKTGKYSYCDKRFMDEVNKSRHEIIVQRRIQMYRLPKTFDTNHGLLGHIKYAHTNKTHKCNECNLIFPVKSELKSHMASHSSDITLSQCPICPKVYSSTNALKEHMMKHGDKKRKYKCELCEKVFRVEDNYLSHMKHKHGLM